MNEWIDELSDLTAAGEQVVLVAAPVPADEHAAAQGL